MQLPFIREISFQIEKESDSFGANLDFKTKFLLINDTHTVSLKICLNIKSDNQYDVAYEI